MPNKVRITKDDVLVGVQALAALGLVRLLLWVGVTVVGMVG